MARHAHMFQCNHCGGFNYPMLDETMNGHYIIVCGNEQCHHKHYRTIEMGRVIDEGKRHSKTDKECDVIHVVPSAFSKTKRVEGSIAQFRAKAAAGLAE